MTGNCLRLDGTGDLNHYSCVDRFTNGCPTRPYTDDELYTCRSTFAFRNIDYKIKYFPGKRMKISVIYLSYFTSMDLTTVRRHSNRVSKQDITVTL